MSYIVPQKMPMRCFECREISSSTIDGYSCGITHKSLASEHGINVRRPDWCPLVEIPTPHGRLIDADKFAETLKKVSIRQGYDNLFSDNILSVGDVFDAIATDLKGEGLDKYKLAPTVIEAEGSETDA